MAFVCVMGVVSHADVTESLEIRVLDVNKLFGEHPEVIAFNIKWKAKTEELRQKNEIKLKGIREIADKLEVLNKQIDDPALTEKKKKQLIRQRLKLVDRNKFSCQTMKKYNRRISNRSDEMEARQLEKKVLLSIFNTVKKMDYDLVIDRSARGLSGSLFVIYGAEALDITQQVREEIQDEKQRIQKAERPADGILKIATVDMTRLYKNSVGGEIKGKKERMDEIALKVKRYALKQGFHLVLDRSSESSHYSQTLMILKGAIDITDDL